MSRRSEYTSILTVSKNELEQMMYAQVQVYDFIDEKINSSQLINALGPVSTILGLIFIQSTPVGVAAAVGSIISGITFNEKEMIKAEIDAGLRGLVRLHQSISQNPNIQLAQVKLPFLEFIDYNFRVVTGDGLILGLLINGHWYH